MHSWPAVALCYYAYHRIHPPAAALYTHILSVFRGLRSLDPDNLRDLRHVFESPPCPRPRGPVQVFCSQMMRLGIVKGIEWDEWVFPEKTVHLLSVPAKEFAHLLRNAIRAHGKAHLVQQRRCYRDVNTMDMVATAALYRSGGQGLTSELVCLIGDGVWNGERQSKAHLRESPNCPLCSEPETTHHILWECPRWEMQRGGVPELCREAVRDSISAKDCGICHLHYSGRVKQLWPQYQLALAKIIQAYQEAASHERRAARGVGVVHESVRARDGHPPQRRQLSDNPEIAQATALEPFWHTSDTFPITAMLTREQNGARWPFSEQALSQLLWFLQLLRRPPEGVDAPPVSVLELYFCLLLCNGGHRFLSGVSEEGHGQRLAVQVDKFTRGILAWQTMSRTPHLP